MDKYKKYRKIRNRLDLAAFMIAFITSDKISQALGITGKKLLSWDTALSFVIMTLIYAILHIFSVKIADKWYERKLNKL
jgi:hypothetical protein